MMLIKKAVNEKVVAKHFKVKEIEIHRSVRETFVRGNVLIEPAFGAFKKN